MLATAHGGAVTAADLMRLFERVRAGGSMSEVLRELARLCAQAGGDGARAWLELKDESGPLVMTSWPAAPLTAPELVFDDQGSGSRPLAAGDALLTHLEAAHGARAVFTTTGGLTGALAVVTTVDAPDLVGQLELLTSAARALVHGWDVERRLRELAERHRLVAQATQHVVYDWDIAGDTVQWNARLHELFGHPPAAGHDRMTWWRGQVHQDDRERAWSALQRALKERELYWTCEYRFRRGDGGWAWVFDRGAIVYDADARPVRMLGVMEDISRDRELESRLTLAARLAAVGTLASGIAHEINNPLAWVTSNLGFALEELKHLAAELPGSERCEELAEALDDAQTGAERIAQIVNDLRTFAHADHERVSPVAVRRVVESALTMAHNELKHRARIVKQLDATPMVMANESRLGQAVVNLLLNAAWAAGSPGHAAEVRLTTSTDVRGHAAIAVTDNGPAIPAEVLPHVFDPFYAARPGSEGLGLGLAVTFSIVTGLGGALEVESTKGGTTFRLTLPPVPADVVVAPTPPPPPRELARRPLVMVVDDEPAILTAIERMLGNGWEVRGFTGGAAALASLAEREPDVILCDVMMPGLSGADLFARLQASWPHLVRRVVLLTGGAFTREAQLFVERCSAPVLEKPFSTRVLKELVVAIAST